MSINNPQRGLRKELSGLSLEALISELIVGEGVPYICLFGDDWLSGTASLNSDERNALMTITALICATGRLPDNDIDRLSRRFGMTKARAKKAIQGLIDTGKITIFDEKLAQKRAIFETVLSQKKSKTGKENNQNKHKKGNKNNDNALTDGYNLVTQTVTYPEPEPEPLKKIYKKMEIELGPLLVAGRLRAKTDLPLLSTALTRFTEGQLITAITAFYKTIKAKEKRYALKRVLAEDMYLSHIPRPKRDLPSFKAGTSERELQDLITSKYGRDVYLSWFSPSKVKIMGKVIIPQSSLIGSRIRERYDDVVKTIGLEVET